jgi:hypothetical protein
MEKAYRVIRTPADLGALSVLPLMQPRPRGIIRFEADTLSEEQRAVWERQLNRAYGACACGEASLGTISGVLLAGLWLAVVGAGDPGFGWADAGVLFAGAVGGTALGKVMGLVRAQAKLERVAAEIGTQWDAPRPAVTDSACG